MGAKIYDANGNEIVVGGGETRELLPTTTHLVTNFMNTLKASWNAMLAECDGNYYRIPIMAYTDQHGDWNNVNAVLNAVDANCDWNKLSKVLQLGDCTGNEALAKVVAWMPFGKQINVIGNHDMENLNPLADHTPIMKYFPCDNGRQFNGNEWWTIIDDKYNVKYIVVNDLEMPEGESHTHWYQSLAQVEWMISELEKADGYDIIICSHCYFDDDTSTAAKRDGTSYNRESTLWPWSRDLTANASFHSLLAARKNKTSGTYTDADGHSVPYDFRNCNSELLIAFHGHDHTESYQQLTNSITSYAFECFYTGVGKDYTFYFGYIDRKEKKFKNWKLYQSITAVDVQEIDIN